MNLTLANIGINLVYYGVTAVLGPWLMLLGERWLGLQRYPHPWLLGIALLLGPSSVVLQLWCIVLLQRRGGGTPSPALPTKHLVTTGPYRFVRNPLNIGEVGLFLALAAWFGSMALLTYALFAWLAFHLFIVFWEERESLRSMPENYARYRASTHRWLPTFPRRKREAT